MTDLKIRPPVVEASRGPAPRWLGQIVHNWFNIATAAIVALVVFAVAYPIIRLVKDSFFAEGHLDLSYYSRVVHQTWFPSVLINSVVLVLISGALAVAVATVIAWLNERTDATLGSVGAILPIVPLLIPTVALAIGWSFLAAPNQGYLNTLLRPLLNLVGKDFNLNIYSWPGMVFLYTLYLVPYVYLVVSSAFRNADPALEEASRINGASLFRTIRKVSLPSIKPAVGAASLIVIISGMSLYSVPAIVGTQANIGVLSVRLVELVTGQYPPETSSALALGSLLIAFILPFWILQRRVTNSRESSRIGGVSRRISRVELGRWRWVARAFMILYMLLTSVVPFLALLLVSFQPFWTGSLDLKGLTFDHFRSALIDNETTKSALWFSIELGLVAGAASIVVSAILALYLRRPRAFGSRTIDAVTKLPAVVSHILVALAVLAAFAGRPFGLGGTIGLLFIGYVVAYLPQATAAGAAAASQVGTDLAEASQICGAGGFRTLVRVILPTMLPGLVSGWTLLFVLIAGELNVAAILASASNPVIGYVVLNFWQQGGYGPLAALASVITVLTTLVVVIMQRFGKPRYLRQKATKSRTGRARAKADFA